MSARDWVNVPVKYQLMVLAIPLAIWGMLAIANHSPHEYPFHTPMLAEMALPAGSTAVPGSCALLGRSISQFGCDFQVPEPKQLRDFLTQELPKRGWRIVRRPVVTSNADWVERSKHSEELVTLCRGTDVLWVFWPPSPTAQVTAIRTNGVTLPCE
jgi:hypothetical protein